MKLLVFGRPDLKVDQIVFDKLLKHCHQAQWDIQERTSLTRDDVATMEIYDITQTPAFIITQDDGKPSHIWQDRVPSYDELATYYI